ncbi:hypothetical protein I9W82_004867 [Candida metapsilosis]|uniref:Uncharacterized protein n=1 Tax=Candida metapsilosis TaxID=273372 RepID=A0A8H7ZB29_9ASCO|nr:hypothetical protein I9W82_004867 [Candida metapsilosis]
MSELEFEDYLLYTASFGFEANMAIGSGKSTSSSECCAPLQKPIPVLNSLSSSNTRVSLPPPPPPQPPSKVDPTVPRRSPARIFDRWKLPSQRLMKAVATAKGTHTTFTTRDKDDKSYTHEKKGSVPSSPESFAESTSSFEMEDDDIDSESVFSDRGDKRVAADLGHGSDIDDEGFEEFLPYFEDVQICKIDDVVTFKNYSGAELTRVAVPRPSIKNEIAGVS